VNSKKTATKKSAPAHGFDASGHMDPAERQRLLDMGREHRDAEPKGLTKGQIAHDALGEGLGEAAVASMTSGGDELGDDLEAEVEEERGGPFVVTSGKTEFAEGTDESNIEGATREPFPTT
jgi:hypothetical protein